MKVSIMCGALVTGVLAAAVSLAGCGSSDSSSESASTNSSTETLSVALGSVGTYDAPVILAQTLGYAKEDGLDLKMSVVGANMLNIVLAGQADIAQGGVGSPLPAIQGGKSTKIIYALESGAVSASVLASSSVKTFADCKKIVTNPVGSNGYTAAMAYVQEVKTKPTVTQLADVSAIVPSLVNGRADCAVTAASYLVPPPGSDLHVIVDPHRPSTMPNQTLLKATGTVLFGLDSNLKDKRPAVVKLMKAMNRAVGYLATATPREVAVSLHKSPLLSSFTVDELTRLYEYDRPFLAPNKGLIDAATWSDNLKLYALDFPYLASGSQMWTYSNVVDPSYLNAAG
jgi:ABC-type nitrate/sulfonate/bicarbonate transport system substrate-binding protein